MNIRQTQKEKREREAAAGGGVWWEQQTCEVNKEIIGVSTIMILIIMK